MSGQKKEAIDANKRELYEQLIATLPKVECKGAIHLHTSLNGNMFSCLHPAGSLALRLPADMRGEFLKKYKSTLFKSYGVVQNM